MPITRKFLGWAAPALPAAAEDLYQNYHQGPTLDLDGVVVVLPGGRAGRRLLELLAELADQHAILFFPPQIRTVGSLPELLYESKRPFANDLTQQMAWVRALQSVDRVRCQQFIPALPSDQELGGWMELGAVLSRQHRELAADALDFADVARLGQQLDGFPEFERWNFLADVQRRYLELLDQVGLWDLQTARRFAIEHNQCHTELDIVILGTADMNRATRFMLDQVADRVTAMIHAPASLADRFDEHGCIAPATWQDATIDLRTRQVQIAEGPADQASLVTQTIAGYGDRYRADQIVIGVLDEQLIPQLQRTLLQADVPSRWVVGRSLPQTAPYQLLSAISAYVNGRRFTDFAALVRHPDVCDWLESQDIQRDWLTQLDRYYNEHLPVRPGNWLGSSGGTSALRQVHAVVERALEPLSEDKPQALPTWGQRISTVLLEFYEGSVLDSTHPQHHFTIKSLSHVRQVLLEHNQVPTPLSPELSATEAIALLLQQLVGEKIPSLPDDRAIELLGWLELPLDEAPALIVTTFNEGYVPKSVNSDLFLPNTLRQKLGLLDNDRRYARDAYALSVLNASRAELKLIAGRHTRDNDPLVPSRLVFATDDETIAQRALAFFKPADSTATPSSLPVLQNAPDAPPQLVVRRPPAPAEPIATVSVTAFRSYLACPYRFYLRHVLQLASVDDEAEELDAPTFGNVIHEVLRVFGENDVRNSTDAVRIRRFLTQAALRHIEQTFGDRRPPAVDVQTAQLIERLSAFARWQAGWASQGWQIKYVEASCSDPPAELRVDDNRRIVLRGRIDRIDYHAGTGEWAVFDYKTSDTAKPPDKTHRKRQEWIDLQLPLYRHLIRGLGIEEPVRLGYIVLPKDASKVGELWAEWDEQTLVEADEVAIQVAEAILDGRFWPPTVPAPDIMNDYAAICQDQAFRPHFENEEEAGAAEEGAQ